MVPPEEPKVEPVDDMMDLNAITMPEPAPVEQNPADMSFDVQQPAPAQPQAPAPTEDFMDDLLGGVADQPAAPADAPAPAEEPVADMSDLLGMTSPEQPAPAASPAPANPPMDLADLMSEAAQPSATPVAPVAPVAPEAAAPESGVPAMAMPASDVPAPAAPAPVEMPEPTSVTMAAELGNRAYLRTEWRRNMTEWLNRKEQLENKTKELEEKVATVKKLHEDIDAAKKELEEKQLTVKKKRSREGKVRRSGANRRSAGAYEQRSEPARGRQHIATVPDGERRRSDGRGV